jgi:hypothetical protein
MKWNLVWNLLKIDDELDTVQLLREHTPPERFYLVDWRARLVADIDRGRETQGDDSGWLVSDEDRPR